MVATFQEIFLDTRYERLGSFYSSTFCWKESKKLLLVTLFRSFCMYQLLFIKDQVSFLSCDGMILILNTSFIEDGYKP